MKMHHLNCASFCPLTEKFINGKGSLIKRGLLVTHCQLIETNDGLILIDTGLGTQDIIDPKNTLPGPVWQFINDAQLKREETAIHQITRLGFNPRDVRHIVVTHLDFDHAGGLVDFPWAKVHVYRPEHHAAIHRPRIRDRMRYAPRQFSHQPDWVLHETAGEKWFGFDSVRALSAPGLNDEILLIPLVGHTAGHCGVAVKSGGSWILNCGDAAFFHQELDSPHRHCPIGLRVYQNVFQHDRRERIRNQERLRQLVQTAHGEVQVFCSHDPVMMKYFAGRQPEIAQKAA